MLYFLCTKLNANDTQSPSQARPKTQEWLENQPVLALPQAESCTLALLWLHNPAQQHMCKSICSARSYKAGSVKKCTPSIVAFKGLTVTDLESSCSCWGWTPWTASLLGDSHAQDHCPAEWPPCHAHYPLPPAPKSAWMLKAEYLQTTAWLSQEMSAFVSYKNTGGVLSAGVQGPSSLLGCCRIFSWCWVFSVWPELTHWMLPFSAMDHDFSAFWAVSWLQQTMFLQSPKM